MQVMCKEIQLCVKEFFRLFICASQHLFVYSTIILCNRVHSVFYGYTGWRDHYKYVCTYFIVLWQLQNCTYEY